jgi:hypothetical protein
VVVELAGVEQREPEPMEDRRHVPSRLGLAPVDVGVDDSGRGEVELAVADLIGGDAGDGGDHGQRVPLQGDVARVDPQPLARLDKPGVGVGAERPGGGAQPEVDTPEHVGVDGEPAGHHQPRREGPGLADGVELTGAAHLPPATGSLELRAEGAGGLHRGAARSPVGGAHRRLVGGDEIDMVGCQGDGGGHQVLAMAWASIASVARRYSPASQSLARCR